MVMFVRRTALCLCLMSPRLILQLIFWPLCMALLSAKFVLPAPALKKCS